MEAVIFAFVSYFAWGVGILFEAIAARRTTSFTLLFWGCALGFLLSSLYAPFAIPQLQGLTGGILLLCYGLAFFMSFGSICYYEALKKGNPSLVGTIGSSFPFVTVILSIVFLGERISPVQLAVIAVIFIGLVFSTLDVGQLQKGKLALNQGVLLSLITMLSWGVYATLVKIPIKAIGWFWPNWFIFTTFPLIFLYIRMTHAKLEIPKKKHLIVPVVLSIILVRIAEYSYNYALSRGMVSIVAPIAGANPTLFVLLSYFVFKERLTKSQVIGVVTTLLGVVALSALSI